MRYQKKANPAGVLGIAGNKLTYAEKKALNDGITLRIIEEEQTAALYRRIETYPKREKRFAAIHAIEDLCGGVSNG